MGMLGGLMNVLHLEDEYEDEYEDDFEEEDESPSRRTKKSFIRKDYTSEDDFEEEEVAPKLQQPKPLKPAKTNKIVPMRSNNVAAAPKQMEVCVIKPTNVDDGREIADTLLAGRAVILNLEGIHMQVAQRIVDFASGACYSMNGNLQKVSNYIFIITPASVDISGDFHEMMSTGGNGGFDVPAYRAEA